MCHDMISGDPGHIKRVLFEDSKNHLSRSPSLDRAVLQCIHALSIPVRVGIPYVARTQTLYWSTQHFICHLECAVLLTLWMQNIAEAVHVNGLASLREDERKLLAMAQSLVQETHLREAVAIGQGGEEENHVININRLAVLMSRLWAEISGGIHVFDFVRRIGKSLAVNLLLMYWNRKSIILDGRISYHPHIVNYMIHENATNSMKRKALS